VILSFLIFTVYSCSAATFVLKNHFILVSLFTIISLKMDIKPIHVPLLALRHESGTANQTNCISPGSGPLNLSCTAQHWSGKLAIIEHKINKHEALKETTMSIMQQATHAIIMFSDSCSSTVSRLLTLLIRFSVFLVSLRYFFSVCGSPW